MCFVKYLNRTVTSDCFVTIFRLRVDEAEPMRDLKLENCAAKLPKHYKNFLKEWVLVTPVSLIMSKFCVFLTQSSKFIARLAPT
jgi:hypothetical protein